MVTKQFLDFEDAKYAAEKMVGKEAAGTLYGLLWYEDTRRATLNCLSVGISVEEIKKSAASFHEASKKTPMPISLGDFLYLKYYDAVTPKPTKPSTPQHTSPSKSESLKIFLKICFKKVF